MRPRDKVSEAHQNAVIDQFVAYLNSDADSKFKIIDRPDPPDAIISDGTRTTWVEHTDLYRSGDEARDELSYVTPGEDHKPHTENPIHDPDNRIAKEFVNRMRDKLSKNSYAETFRNYGPGYLVISERDALFNKDSLAAIEVEIERNRFPEDKRFFAAVHFAVRTVSGLDFAEVHHSR